MTSPFPENSHTVWFSVPDIRHLPTMFELPQLLMTKTKTAEAGANSRARPAK
jgi:hypothetical protein